MKCVCGHELEEARRRIFGIYWFGHFFGVTTKDYLHKTNKTLSEWKCSICGCTTPKPEMIK